MKRAILYTLFSSCLGLASLGIASAKTTQSPEEELIEPPSLGTPYALDSVSRDANPTGKLRCPNLDMVRHRGKFVRYHKPVPVFRGFQPKLERFEELVVEVAKEVYGRAPKRIHHFGTFNCRRIRKIPDLLSEHAMANAIDIEAFSFPRAKKGSKVPHKALRRSFKVTVDKHWDATSTVGAIHSQFLRTLTDRMIEEDLFRVMLGPAFPGHQDHFHFDMAPYRLIEL